MFLLWLFGFIVVGGLSIAYMRANLERYDLEDVGEEPTILIIAVVFGLLWFIMVPIWFAYQLGKLLFKPKQKKT